MRTKMAARMLSKIPLVVILGPTGSGKSKLAIEIAKLYNGEIISTDSMQVYKGLDIVTNKVTNQEMDMCKHHLINYVSPLKQDYTVTDFRDEAVKVISALHAQDILPVIVGGTNYYIEAVLWNLLVNARRSQATPSQDGKTRETEPQKDLDSSGSDNEGGTYMASRNEHRDRLSKLTNDVLYTELERVDSETAKALHPNNRRKILRALEVFYDSGRKLSEYLSEQHSEPGGSSVSGAMRYKNPCVFWLQCDKKVLDKRLDDRVDEMLDRGLLQELHHFHTQYNETRLQANSPIDYTHGIFQSIGFKEFHDYLILDDEQKRSAEGQKLLKQGIMEMKLVTNRYARRQDKWVRSRFLKRRGATDPTSVYRLDTTNPEQWNNDVYEPACTILDALYKGVTPPIAPVATTVNTNKVERNICTVCGDLVFTNTYDWNTHITSRKHRKAVNTQRKREERNTEDNSHKSTE